MLVHETGVLAATTAFGTTMVGYRLHPVGDAGFMFRVGAMALIGKGLSLSAGDPEKIGVLPWLYRSRRVVLRSEGATTTAPPSGAT
jgi:hypothetical protein